MISNANAQLFYVERQFNWLSVPMNNSFLFLFSFCYKMRIYISNSVQIFVIRYEIPVYCEKWVQYKYRDAHWSSNFWYLNYFHTIEYMYCHTWLVLLPMDFLMKNFIVFMTTKYFGHMIWLGQQCCGALVLSVWGCEDGMLLSQLISVNSPRSYKHVVLKTAEGGGFLCFYD